MEININVTLGADPAMMELLKTILGTVSIKTVMEHTEPKELPADAGDIFKKRLARKARNFAEDYEAKLDNEKIEKTEKAASKNAPKPEKVASEKPTPVEKTVEKTVEKEEPTPAKKEPAADPKEKVSGAKLIELRGAVSSVISKDPKNRQHLKEWLHEHGLGRVTECTISQSDELIEYLKGLGGGEDA